MDTNSTIRITVMNSTNKIRIEMTLIHKNINRVIVLTKPYIVNIFIRINMEWFKQHEKELIVLNNMNLDELINNLIKCSERKI